MPKLAQAAAIASCCTSAARAGASVAALLFAGVVLAACAQAPGGGVGGVTTQGVETTQEVVTTAAGAAVVTHGPQGLLVTDSDNWRAAYEAGLAAATAGDFKTAVAFFLEAQPKAPLAPQIMYNLGLASARAGYDLLALAWLRAYLVAEPNSAAAGPVAEEIARLEQAIDGQADLLFQKAIELAQTLPTEGGFNGERAGALDVIASFQAGAGRLDDAFATLSLAGSAWASDATFPFDEGNRRMDLIAGYGTAAASVGDVAAAQSVLDRLSDETRRKQVQDAIDQRNRVQSEVNASPIGVRSSGGSCCYIIDPVVEALGRGQSASSVTVDPSDTGARYIVSAAQGDLDAAFAGVKSESDGFLGDQRAYMFNQITRALLFQGDLRAAEAAARLAREYSPADWGFGQLAEVAELLVSARSGDVDAALQDFLDHTKQSLFLRADGAAGIGALEGYIGRREDGLWALCTHLMASGEVDEALGTLRWLSPDYASSCLDQRQLSGDSVDRAAAIAEARDQVRADMLGGAAEIAADRQARILAMNAVAWGIDTRLIDLPEIFRRGTANLETPAHFGSVGGDLARVVWSLRAAATQ